MDELVIRPWKRYGHDRLYVAVVGGESVAWYDRRAGHLEMLDISYRDQVLEVLAPYLAASVSLASHAPEPPAPPSPPAPADDLALNRPGTQLLGRLTDSPSWFGRLLLRLSGQEDASAPWRKGLAGERIVGAELDRLTARGWLALHSVPLPSGADIDHLLIGPGGVYCLNTKHFRDARVWVGDDVVKVNGGPGHPYVRNSRHEGRKASRVLTRACGFPVAVSPVLVFVAPAKVEVVSSLQDVEAIQHREIPAFRRRKGALGPAEIASVHAVARNRGTWL
ncbi:nuclease-related domain-containing protein [Streptomyces sp. NPDC088341]|uniref:nuclease-related domain-containing protein n=1 Tax=Streptomyces sp. NPDC088341 TaxID=3154870 RepID=UPI0034259544